MALITNSHDKSIACRIHDGIWRACLPGCRYWTFRPPLWKLAFNQHGGQMRQSGPVSSQWRLQSSCYPDCTDSYNHRRQIPDRFLHGVKAKQPGCIWLPSKPYHPEKNTVKQRKQAQKWKNPSGSSVLTVIKIKIKCRKGRQHATRFVFLLFLRWES